MLSENKIRKFLKTLSMEELVNSSLYNIDLDNTPLDVIINELTNLYDNVFILKDIIESNFNKEGYRLPNNTKMQNIMI